MAINNFKRSEASVGTARTTIYGPVASGVQAVVFGGTFTNIDESGQSEHKFTLEVATLSSTFSPILKDVPVPYGGSSKCPKIVLYTGESLVAKADAASSIYGSVNILERI